MPPEPDDGKEFQVWEWGLTRHVSVSPLRRSLCLQVRGLAFLRLRYLMRQSLGRFSGSLEVQLLLLF